MEARVSWHWHPGEQFKLGVYIAKWTLLAGIVGVLSGSASAIFLVSLDYATDVRIHHPWLLYLLPVAGLAIGLFYRYLGRGLDGGNNLILEEIHDPQSKIPARLAPVILVATVATHLFGGSAGREGTAVQMGGSLASWLARLLRLEMHDLRTLVMAGVSGGFGSVFGTPIAGMIFGLEVLAIGRMRYDALVPCLIGSAVGHWTCLFWFAFWGGAHGEYAIHSHVEITALLIGKILLAAPLFGLASIFFSELTHALQALFARIASWPPARPLIGGVVLILLTKLVGTEDYLGLSLPLLHRPFDGEPVRNFDFAWKLVFTAITLGAGFKGGEVTPLFVIGATLGATLGAWLGVPIDFLAALGFVAVFAAAANTPLACTAMGIELFGATHALPIAIACVGAYLWAGHRGIYLSQRVATPKGDVLVVTGDPTLGSVRNGVPADGQPSEASS
jgi:H+/Cl- antiporter ClcA